MLTLLKSRPGKKRHIRKILLAALVLVCILLLTLVFEYQNIYRIRDVMVSVLSSSVVDRGFKPRSGQTKDDEIGMCCSSAKHAVLRRKSKDGFARNQDNASEWGDLSFRGLLLQ
jgi:hypothetical protein